jgi:hypothetical protein
MASSLPSLWSSLNLVFRLEEETESSPWCAYDNGILLLSSVINLKVKNPETTKSIISIKKSLFDTGIEGAPWKSPLNTYSVLVVSQTYETSSGAVEVFIHADIPYLFIQLHVNSDVIIDNFDSQIMSKAYFDFMLEYGFISMNNGIVKIGVTEESNKKIKTPDIYGGL